jgi:hypothetical protein
MAKKKIWQWWNNGRIHTTQTVPQRRRRESRKREKWKIAVNE